MSEKRPQLTATIVQRLHRLARCCDREAAHCRAAADRVVDDTQHAKNAATWKARANTCWQAAARLQELQQAARYEDTRGVDW